MKKHRKAKRPAQERVPLQLATNINEVLSINFVSDSLPNGRRIKCQTVVGDFSKESLEIAVHYGISGQHVTHVLDQMAWIRGYPAALSTDSCPEFTSRVFLAWTQTNGIRHISIEPGKPMHNGYIEGVNGKFRDECLNERWFECLHQTRVCIVRRPQDYKEVRPHSSLGRIPPARFVQDFAETLARSMGADHTSGHTGHGNGEAARVVSKAVNANMRNCYVLTGR